MSIELAFLIDLAADFALLAATARSLGLFRLRRVGFAAAFAALYGTLARCLPSLASPPIQLSLLVPLTLWLTRLPSPRAALTFALSLGMTAIVTGTCAAYCRHVPLAVAAIPPLCACGTRLRRSWLTAPRARVEIVNEGQVAVLNAFVDTGNRLTEPLSGQPVLIANAELIRHVLPGDGYRQVAYGSVGGPGTLRCFRPDRVTLDIQGRRCRAPDTWVALFPGRLPGPAQALAPAEYMLQ